MHIFSAFSCIHSLNVLHTANGQSASQTVSQSVSQSACEQFLLITDFFFALRPNAGHGLLILEFFLDHTQRRTTVGRTPLDE